MKTIKFRAWDKRNKKIFNAIEFKTDMSDYAVFNGMIYPEYDQSIWKELILMQFTGLKDRNGKDIYDGDIVNNWLDVMYKVAWSSTRIGWYLEGITTHADILSNASDPEVIGNIYENPELIDEKY